MSSIFLLMYERRKRLPEAWYCHRMFWGLNFIINLIMIFLEAGTVSVDKNDEDVAFLTWNQYS